MTRNRILVLIFLAFVLAASSCSDDSDIVSGTGTVTYLSLEGGFYGIIADDGEHYDPTNLPPEFRQDGLRVRFEAVILRDQYSVHMWGTIVEIISIEELH